MDLNDILEKRYSCRSYSNKEVDDGLIFNIIQNSVLAPNSGNLQAWKFIIIKNKEKREEIALGCIKQMWMTQAPVHIVICSDLDVLSKQYKNRADLYATQDCAAAAENILLLATNYGLASCWVGAFDNPMIKRTLSIPDNIIPKIIITLGYESKKPREKIRYSIDSYTFFDEYGNKSLDKGIFPLAKNKEIVKEKSKNLFLKIKNLFKHSE